MRGGCLLGASSAALALLAAVAASAQDAPTYGLAFDARVVPTERAAHLTVRLSDPRDLVHEVRWRIDPERHRNFSGDGEVVVEDDVVRWTPPAGEASFRLVFRIDHLRDERSYDARSAESWAIFRGDDLVPPARVRTEDGALSVSRLRLRAPDGWSVVTPYPRENGWFTVSHPHRRFDRPTGWFVLGELGVVRETVAGSRVAIAGPRGQRFRRLDILALLNWTLPSLRTLLGPLPERLLVVGAGDPMWRGGLSGPGSTFIHATRPLISGDGTSPVLHEVVHVVLGLEPGSGGDWIVEGLAELYSLEALVRSRTLSRRRFQKSLARLEQRGTEASKLEVPYASGAVTARAVGVLRGLDAEIRAATGDEKSLADAVRLLREAGKGVTTASLRAAAEQVSGLDLSTFFTRHVGRAAGS